MQRSTDDGRWILAARHRNLGEVHSNGRERQCRTGVVAGAAAYPATARELIVVQPFVSIVVIDFESLLNCPRRGSRPGVNCVTQQSHWS